MQAIMAAIMGYPIGSEMFMHPQPLDGRPVNPTEGRGWADECGPDCPFLRSSRRWAGRIQHMLAAQDGRALQNANFVKVNLTSEEELVFELRKTPRTSDATWRCWVPTACVSGVTASCPRCVR